MPEKYVEIVVPGQRSLRARIQREMKRLWKFAKLLFGKWHLGVLYLLSVVAALNKYFSWVVLPPWVPSLILMVALILAAYSIFSEMETENEALRARIAELEAKPAHLVIHPLDRSWYVWVTNPSQGSYVVEALFIELGLFIENRGTENSIVNRFDLEIPEAGGLHKDVKPILFQSGLLIQGRTLRHALSGAKQLATDGTIEVLAHRKTDGGVLRFYFREHPPQTYNKISCRLTLTDTNGNSVAHKFELRDTEA